MGRMGRRRFEIRAFGQLRRWNQTCECLLYENSSDLFTVDPRGLT